MRMSGVKMATNAIAYEPVIDTTSRPVRELVRRFSSSSGSEGSQRPGPLAAASSTEDDATSAAPLERAPPRAPASAFGRASTGAGAEAGGEAAGAAQQAPDGSKAETAAAQQPTAPVDRSLVAIDGTPGPSVAQEVAASSAVAPSALQQPRRVDAASSAVRAAPAAATAANLERHRQVRASLSFGPELAPRPPRKPSLGLSRASTGSSLDMSRGASRDLSRAASRDMSAAPAGTGALDAASQRAAALADDFAFPSPDRPAFSASGRVSSLGLASDSSAPQQLFPEQFASPGADRADSGAAPAFGRPETASAVALSPSRSIVSRSLNLGPAAAAGAPRAALALGQLSAAAIGALRQLAGEPRDAAGAGGSPRSSVSGRTTPSVTPRR